MTAAVFYHTPDLAWTTSEEEDKRFRKIVRWMLLLFLLFAIAIPFLPLPELKRDEAEKVPPRLAKFILEREKERPKPKAPARSQSPSKAKQQRIARARKKASQSGVLAFKEDIAALANNPVLESIQNDMPLIQGAATSKGAPKRSVIGQDVTKGSGGIQTAKLSRDTGGGQLSGRKTTRVTSGIGGGSSAGGGSRGGKGGGGAGRTEEEIRLIFIKNLGAVYALYHRALRRDPTLAGKFVVEVKIAPSGRVVSARLVSSELDTSQLERKLLARIKLYNFGKKNVPTVTARYTYDFVPS